MIKKLLLLSVITLCFLNNYAQDEKNYDRVKFGKIDPEEFSAKPFGKDSSAAAVVLFNVGYMHFGISNKGRWSYILEIHKRIKILNKEGYDYANFSIPTYNSRDSEESLSGVQAASYNMVNGKLVQNKAAKDEKFTDQFNKNVTNYKYTLSNIEPGTIVEIKYKLQSDRIYTLRDWYFQESIPVIWSDFTLVLPEYFKYKIDFQSLAPIQLLKQTIVNESFSGTIRGEGTAGSSPFQFDCQSEERRWASKNVPAFKDEPFITTSDDFITKMSFEIQSEQYPGVAYHNYSTSWEKITEEYRNAEHFGKFIKPNGVSKKLVTTLINEQDPASKKAAILYSYVKSNIKWNKYTGDYSTENSSKDVLEKKTGNVADINLTLLNLLQSANMKAMPIVLSTRSNGKHPGYPMSSKFNYVVAGLEIDSSFYILDATQPENTVNLVSYEALNHKGLLMDLDNLKSRWIFMDPQEFSTSSIYTVITFDNDLKLKGSTTTRKTLYDAMNTRKRYYSHTNQEEYLKDYKSNKNGLNILKYTQTDFDKPESPITELFEFELEDYMEEAGNLVYFNPLFYERTKENPLKADERKFPIDLAYPTAESYRLLITVPDGYEVDKLPTSILYKLEDNSASFTYTVNKVDKQIVISSKIAFSKSQYDAERYPELKELFKQIVAKESQPVVFKKL